MPAAPALRRLALRVAGRVPAPLLRRVAASRVGARLGEGLSGRGEVFIARGRGAGLRFDARGSNPGYAVGLSEPLVQDALWDHLRPGATFYDIGANVGFFTLLGARRVGSTGCVHAFEPLPANAAALRQNVTRNGFENVEVHECAVGERNGQEELLVAEEGLWARLGSLDSASHLPRTLVAVTTLDRAIEIGDLPPPEVVKIDVEGAEVAVLAGMPETLARHRPIIICELHKWNATVAGQLADADYEVTTLEGESDLEVAGYLAHALAVPR